MTRSLLLSCALLLPACTAATTASAFFPAHLGDPLEAGPHGDMQKPGGGDGRRSLVAAGSYPDRVALLKGTMPPTTGSLRVLFVVAAFSEETWLTPSASRAHAFIRAVFKMVLFER